LAPDKGEKGEKNAPYFELLIEKTDKNSNYNLNSLKPPKVIELLKYLNN
jgi:hypothetical protein